MDPDRFILIVSVLTGVGTFNGCCRCPAARHSDRQEPRIQTTTMDRAHAESQLDLKRSDSTGEILVDSDSQMPHYVGDGNGGIRFVYWEIGFRSSKSLCVSMNTIHANAYTPTGELSYCGSPAKLYQILRIKDSDIVP